MSDSIEKDQNLEEENELEVWGEASGATNEDILNMKATFKDLPEIKGMDIYDAALEIRRYLIEKGFVYDEAVFTLQDVLENKSGNCLSLSLLIGSILKENGFNPEFQIETNPRDPADKDDQEYFEGLVSGKFFDYNSLVLPKVTEQAEDPIFRFAPEEHSTLVLGGRRFETTNLDKDESNLGRVYEAERIMLASFDDVVSNVYLDRVTLASQNSNMDIKEKEILINKAIELSNNNREIYTMLWDIGLELGNEKIKSRALKEYTGIGGDDSRYYFNLYKMTDEQKYLDESLNKYPSYIKAYFEKNVILETDKRDARFSFSVIAWCVANSNHEKLNDFYKRNSQQLERLFSREEIKALD